MDIIKYNVLERLTRENEQLQLDKVAQIDTRLRSSVQQQSITSTQSAYSQLFESNGYHLGRGSVVLV